MGFGSYQSGGPAMRSFAGPARGGGLFRVTPDVFFARQTIRDALDQATFRTLSRIGARVRLTARRSIRRRAGPSRPGKPPHTHTDFLRNDILYGLDQEEHAVVIGPWKSPWFNELHEFGGDSLARTYPERPFMGPALEKNLDKIAPEWRDSVRA